MKAQYQPQTFVAAGFSVIILLIFIIVLLWTYSEQENNKQAERIVEAQFESRKIGEMLHAAHHRTILLYKMSTLEDPFERDEVYLRFLKSGEKIIKNREAIMSSGNTPSEKEAWEQVGTILNKGSTVQRQILELIENDRSEEAYKTLATVLSPIQEQLSEKLTKVLDVAETSLAQELESTAQEKKNIYVLIVLLGVLALLLGLLTYLVTKRTARTESALAKQANRLQSLYEVASMTGLSLSDQIHETLKVGCRLFNLEIGKLCKIDTEENTNTFVDVVAPHITNIAKEAVVPLEKTFCSIPYGEDNIVMIHNIVKSKYRAYPCTEFAELGSYIAAPITVNGQKYGTINFSSFKAKLTPFSQTDKDLLYLIGRWVGVALERQLSEQYQIEKKVAEDADLAKSSFLASMSHEFRTPLNAILGYSELLIEDCDKTGEIKIKEDLNKIHSSGNHLLSLVNNVLDLSKIESGKMELNIEEFFIASIVDPVIDTVRPLMAKNGNSLVIDDIVNADKMCSDKTKLRQILLNLFSNAAKFTENGKITFQILNQNIGGIKFLEFIVHDTGIGMTEDQLIKVFDEFAQADKTITSKYGGSGLGLSICKKYSHMLGGDIKVSSTIGEGSEFRLVLPMNINRAVA